MDWELGRKAEVFYENLWNNYWGDEDAIEDDPDDWMDSKLERELNPIY